MSFPANSSIASPDKQARAESIVEVLWRRRQLVLVVFLLFLMAAALAVKAIPKRVTVSARLLVTRNLPANTDKNAADFQTFLNTQAELAKSSTVLSMAMGAPNLDQLSFFAGSENPVNTLKERMVVTPQPQTSFLLLQLSSMKPEEALKIVSAVSQAYTSYVADQRRNVAIGDYTKITEDRSRLDAQRTDAQRLLYTLRGETQAYIGGAGATENLAIQKFREYSDKLADAQAKTTALKNQYEDALKGVGMTPDSIDQKQFATATAVSAQNLPVLQNNLAGLNQQLIEAKRQFVPTHPAVRQIKAQIKDVQLSQAITLKGMYESAVTTERSARELYLTQEAVAKNVSAQQAELAVVENRAKDLDDQVKLLDKKLSELTLSESVGIDAREEDEASIDPNSAVPNTWKTLAFASLIGLTVGMMTALMREWVSPSLGNVHRIADTIGVPVLGTLPRISGQNLREIATITHDNTGSTAAEAFRSIRTSMLFGAANCQTITVTSPAAKDGKTTLATNLAISLAQSGKRVALVDANFREPSLHKLFDVDNAIGLSGVLDGEDLESSLRRTPIEHLDVLTSGSAAGDISEKLNSSRFTDLLNDLNVRYDHIIFDTSSVAGSNDARVIAAGCDTTILVAREERTNRFAATNARDALLSVGAQLMGIVLNDSARVGQAYPQGIERRDPGAAERSRELLARLRSRE